jgi:hypothetical protein
MIFLTSLRGPWVADGAHELAQTQAHEPLARPLLDLLWPEVATLALDQQAHEPLPDVAVDLDELDDGIPAFAVT